MRIKTLLGTVARLVRRASNGRNYTLLLGTVAGVYLLTACHLFLATFGTSPQSATALALALALGFELAWKPQRDDRSSKCGQPGSRRSEDGGHDDSPLTTHAMRSHGLFALLAAAWMFALPWGFELALSAAGLISMDVMAAPGRGLMFQVLTAVVLLSPPLYWLVRTALLLPRFLRDAPTPRSDPDAASVRVAPQTKYRWRDFIVDVWQWCRSLRGERPKLPAETAAFARYLFGVVAGVLLCLFATGPTIGLYAGAMIGAVVGTLVFLVVWVRSPSVERQESRVESQSFPTSDLRPPTSGPPLSTRLRHAATVMTAGVLVAALLRMLNQLAAEAAYLVYFEWSMILLGATIGIRWKATAIADCELRNADWKRSSSSVYPIESAIRNQHSAIPPFFLALVGAVTLAAFSLLIDWSLWINAFVVAPWLTIAARCAIVAAVLVPFGFGWGRLALAPVADAPGSPRKAALPAFSLFAFICGFLAARWIAFDRLGTADTLLAAVWSLAVLAGIQWALQFRSKRRVAGAGATYGTEAPGDAQLGAPSGSTGASLRSSPGHPSAHHSPLTKAKLWTKRAGFAAALALLVALSWLRSSFDPVRSARQLFATNVFVARMRGLDRGMLSFLDEGRPVAVEETRRGTLTVWRYRGTQLQLRENGVPKALVSTNPRLVPHFSAEVMPAALPMVLHERPHHVLILGTSGGVSLTTVLSFPVKSVTCVEGDGQLVELLRRRVWSESKRRPAADARVQWVSLEPALAVACGGDAYDVIVSTPDESALLKSSPYFTRGFYRGVSRRLADDGIFCQRFHQVDYGVMPLQTAVKTLQSVFRTVGTIEIAAGEMALLATNSPRGLTRAGLVERFQAQHVRTVLARIGWDWSFPLNLTAYGNDGLRKFADAPLSSRKRGTRVNTAANGFFAFRLPQEMMRWAPKWRELVTKLAPHRTRLLESPNIEGNDRVLLRRLSEVAGQRKLTAGYPDQWWAYRKSLRQQLEERPRTLLKKSRSGGIGNAIHPEDRRRMRYFEDLDRATKNPTVERAGLVASYAEPYDPLLSRFAHLEAATLYSRPEARDERAELWHRLHAVYFAESQDRSVRNVAKALTLLAGNEGVVDRPADRWDHLDALLQEMKARWERRGLVLPRSPQVVLNDLELSLDAIEAALKAMDGLHASVPVSASDWQARRKVVQRGLVDPLRAYRSQLLRKHQNERERMRQLLEKLEKEEEKQTPKKPTDAAPLRPAAN
jgi:Spermine/spermidine synthase domain